MGERTGTNAERSAERLALILSPRGLQRRRRLPYAVLRGLAIVRTASPKLLTLSVLLELVVVAATIGQLVVLRELVSALTASPSSRDSSAVVRSLLLLTALAAVSQTLPSVAVEVRRLLTERVNMSVDLRILGVAQHVPLERFEDPRFFDLLERARTNAARQPVLLVSALSAGVGGLVGSLALTVALLRLSPLVVLVIPLAAVPLLVASSLTGRREYRFAVDNTAATRARLYLDELLSRRAGAQELRANGSYLLLKDRHEALWGTYLSALLVHVRRRGLILLTANLLSAVLTGAALALVAVLVLQERLAVGAAAAAALGVRYLADRLGVLAGTARQLNESALFLEDLDDLFDMPVEASPSHLPVAEVFSELRLERVSFTYPGATRAALSGIDLTIRKGEVVALVGLNGSGKSTLSKVVGQLLPPTDGRVIVDGNVVDEPMRVALRQLIATVFQDFGRYALSALDNIALGDALSGQDPEAVRAAAEKADIATTIESLPARYDTVLSTMFPGGVDLSLGQWQRLAVARAFLRDAPLLILDEPTASLDAVSEARLYEHIATLAAGRAVLLVTHRVTSAAGADKILVLEGGSLIESGSHQDLMQLGGRYCQLHDLQSSSSGPVSRSVGSAACTPGSAHVDPDPRGVRLA